MSSKVEVEITSDAAVVRFHGGENRFDEQFVAEVETALNHVENESQSKVLVTVGLDKYYSNGFDLDFLNSLSPVALERFINRSCDLLGRLLTFPLPTVAAINGHAFGVGAILALAHDLRVMRRDRGWFCLPEVDLDLRLHPFLIALIFDRIPTHSAYEAILTSQRYDSAACLERGIVQSTANFNDLLAEAGRLSQPWQGKSRVTLGNMKRDMHSAMLARLDSHVL
jgi:enoyl-CoA hydratase/carnithine racemase